MPNKKLVVIGKLTLLPFLLFGLSACKDIRYEYNIPEAGDCPAGMNYRSGGSRIVDRSGGSRIVDRSGNEIDTYCEEAECPGDAWSTEPPIIDWHVDKGVDKGDYVVANRVCLAP